MIKKSDIKKSFKVIFIAILLMPFFMPNLTEFAIRWQTFLNKFKILAALIGTIGFVCDIKRVKNNIKIILPIVIFFSIYVYATVSNNGDIETATINSITVVSCCIIICWAMKDVKACLNAMLINYKMLIYINLVSMLMYPNGIYSSGSSMYWFLGYDNTFVWIFIPAICVALLLSQINNKRLLTLGNFIFISVCLVSVMMTWSAMALVGVMLFIIFILYENISGKIRYSLVSNNNKIFSVNFIFYSLMLNLSIAIFRIQEIFSFFIENILKKSATLTGRDAIWDLSLLYIYQKPIGGYGCEFTLDRFSKLHIGNFTFNHCHNLILNVMYEVGMIGLIILIYNIYLCYKRLTFNKNNICSRIIAVSLGIFIIVLITESYQKFIQIFIIFTLSGFITQIIDEYNFNSRNEVRNIYEN